MTDFAKARKHMIDSQILTSGVVDPAIIESFSVLPRELFVPEKLQDIAYIDDNLSLGQGRYLMEASIHARLLQEVAPLADDVVLDIGSASGYSSAVLSPLVTTLIALEHNKRQMDKASRLWEKLELCNIALIEGMLCEGYPDRAPYSLIIINGSLPEVPEEILEQIAPGGRLACFIREEGQVMGQAVLYIRNGGNALSSRVLFDADVPALDGCALPTAFKF